MKAVLFAALVATSAAALTASNTCVLPSTYVGSNCVQNAGYIVSVQCGTATPVTLTDTTAVTNAGILSSTVAGVAGCSLLSNSVVGGTCAAETQTAASQRTFSVACNTAAGFYPTQGAAGSLVCVDPTAAATTNAATGFASSILYSQLGRIVTGTTGVLVPSINQATTANNGFVTSGTGSLVCSQGCTLPSNVCNNGSIINGLTVVDTVGNARLSNSNCLIRLGSTVTFAPLNSAIPVGTAGLPTYTCNTAGAVAPLATLGFLPLAGTGAVSGPILRPRVTPGTMSAGHLDDYPNVVSVLRRAFTFNTLGQFSGRRVDAPVPFGPSTIDVIDVSGCAITDNKCVQTAINDWRCHGFVVDSATRCLNNNVLIPCPWTDLGWDCDDHDSKKSLLGLLGLLGLIPLCLCCLLLCCGLLPCCIRRKKTEADVHFATFDPHAAPVAASVCAPVVPTAVCAEPFGCVDPYVGSLGAAPFAAPATPIF